MKHLTLILLLPLTALALDPTLPVVRLQDGQIVERRQSIPDKYANTYPYKAASYRWESDGWRQAVITVSTNTETVEIPASIQAVATAYKQTMESIYGQGAATNRQLTREYVAVDLSLNTNITADTGLRLSTWFEILDGYWGKGEVWTFPYGESSYTVTNTIETWSEG